MIFSETQDSAKTRHVLYMSVRSEIRLYRQFLNRVFWGVSRTNFSSDLHWTLWGESWTMSRFRGALNKYVRLLDSTDNCLRPTQN